MKALRNEKGFTLLELLIVIIVLALIAVLLFSFLGNPLQKTSVQSSAVQIADNLRVLDEAWNQYYVSKTTEPASIDAIVTEGILKAKPEPPSAAKKSGYSGTFAYTVDTTNYNLGGSTTKDTVILLEGITDDVCKKINHLYAGAGENDAIPNAVTTGKSIQCYNDGTNNIALKQVVAK